MYVIGDHSGELIHVEFPITIGTVPFRIPSGPVPQLEYGMHFLTPTNNCVRVCVFVCMCMSFQINCKIRLI